MHPAKEGEDLFGGSEEGVASHEGIVEASRWVEHLVEEKGCRAEIP